MLIPISGPPAPTVILKLFSHDKDGLAASIALVAMIAAGGIAALAWLVFRRLMARSVAPVRQANPARLRLALEATP
jgi:iron(III) transport system permease protein